jgi:DNA-directed RNA polymerase sigma subunit (sigma70/sigma32)
VIGLYEAVRKYNPNKAAFSTFSYFYIRKGIQKEIANSNK